MFSFVPVCVCSLSGNEFALPGVDPKVFQSIVGRHSSTSGGDGDDDGGDGDGTTTPTMGG